MIKIRLIKKKNRKGEVQVFATSLLDEKTYSKKAILNLYKQRWSIEEAYKMIKCRLEVADFSGLTAWAIQQDFFAKTLLITLCNALCFGIQPKLPKRQPVKRGMEKRVPIINRTYAMKQVINMLTKVTFSLDSFSEWFRRFSIKISKQVEYSPRNQSNKRKFKSNSKYSMAYKNL